MLEKNNAIALYKNLTNFGFAIIMLYNNLITMKALLDVFLNLHYSK